MCQPPWIRQSGSGTSQVCDLINLKRSIDILVMNRIRMLILSVNSGTSQVFDLINLIRSIDILVMSRIRVLILSVIS